MLFMVIERFKNRDAKAVYTRLKQEGRMIPDGLHFISSWVETNYDRCYQLMQTDDIRLFEEWTKNWQDLIEFDFVEVVPSAEAARRAEEL